MSVSIFGTCRLNEIKNNNNLNNFINYTHSTKEVIQFIKFLKGELIVYPPYNKVCFRTGICDNRCIEYNQHYTNLFENTDIFLIEICSNKKYIHGDFYLHHLSVDLRYKHDSMDTPREIMKNHIIEKQSDEEIENDILEIRRMLHPKIVIIVSHYNSKINGEYIESRNHLINLLDNICKKYSIPFINPTKVLSNFTQEQVMTGDLGHYTQLGIKLFTDYVNYILH